MNKNSDGSRQTVPELICDIVRREMGLEADRVVVYNQRFKLPTKEGIFIVVEFKGSKAFSNRNVYSPEDDSEVQTLNTLELISVNILSRNDDALQRKEEVLMAINSIYAQSIQEAHNFRIANISAIDNVSDVEGSSIMYRFEINLSVFAWYEKTKDAENFNTFSGKVRTEDMSKTFEPKLN